MKTSTTFPYLSKRGKRSSAVVPVQEKKKNYNRSDEGREMKGERGKGVRVFYGM